MHIPYISRYWNHWSTLCSDSMVLSSNLFGGLRKTHLFSKRAYSISRSSKVINFGTNRKRLCDFLLVRYSNLDPTLDRFRDIVSFFASHPYSTLTLGCSRWTRSPVVGSARAFTLSYSAVKLFSKYSNLCDHGTWTSQTDRGSNMRTDDIMWHNRALISIVW